jgi:hypothetical protein
MRPVSLPELDVPRDDRHTAFIPFLRQCGCHRQPSPTAASAALRDEQVTVSRKAIDAVRSCMTNGVDSALDGRDPPAARRRAEALRNLVTAEFSRTRSRSIRLLPEASVPHPSTEPGGAERAARLSFSSPSRSASALV